MSKRARAGFFSNSYENLVRFRQRYILSDEIQGSFRAIYPFFTNITHKIDPVKLFLEEKLQNKKDASSLNWGLYPFVPLQLHACTYSGLSESEVGW